MKLPDETLRRLTIAKSRMIDAGRRERLELEFRALESRPVVITYIPIITDYGADE